MTKSCKNCGALYLKDFYTENKEFNNGMFASNIDDIFRKLSEEGIKEVFIDENEMLQIVLWIASNAKQAKENYKLLTEGKVNKFLGIKLKLK